MVLSPHCVDVTLFDRETGTASTLNQQRMTTAGTSDPDTACQPIDIAIHVAAETFARETKTLLLDAKRAFVAAT